MTPENPAREIERLRRENEALDEQVKLLVQTEQRLYRSQNELDVQLARIRALAGFALACSGAESPIAVLERALGLLASAFSLDWTGVVLVDAGSGDATLAAAEPRRESTDAAERLAPEDVAWVAALPEPRMFPVPPEGGGPPAAVLRLACPSRGTAAPAEGGVLACVPLRPGGRNLYGLVLACGAARKRFHYRHDDLAERHLPFLQLLGHHVDRALENAVLTASLRERTHQLGASLERLQRAQEELLHAQKMEAVGTLAGGVAHDFNNLLTVILGHAAVLKHGLPLDAARARDVDRVIEAGERAASIARQLLAFGRRQFQRRENVDLCELTRTTADLLNRVVGEHITLDLELDPELAPVRADRAQIEQVLLNLVVNARDAMPDGGVMRIVARRAEAADAAACDAPVDPDAMAALDVIDAGVGMDEAIKARIFEPFFTTKALGNGTGLGLAVVYGIVMQSEGHILVDSAPHRGSRFTVLLPLSQAAEPRAAARRDPPEPEGPATVLVVEDEPMIRDVVAEVLVDAGFRVICAEDGEAALAAAKEAEDRVDLLLTDVVMPRLGGLKLAAALRGRRPDLRVIFMSGYSEDLVAAERADGVRDPFLPKPFSPSALLDCVVRVLQQSARKEGQQELGRP